MDFYSEASSRPFAHGQISWYKCAYVIWRRVVFCKPILSKTSDLFYDIIWPTLGQYLTVTICTKRLQRLVGMHVLFNKVFFLLRGKLFLCRVFSTKWTDCIIDKIFKNIEIVKFITTALKSTPNLVELQSLVAKCCKI